MKDGHYLLLLYNIEPSTYCCYLLTQNEYLYMEHHYSWHNLKASRSNQLPAGSHPAQEHSNLHFEQVA